MRASARRSGAGRSGDPQVPGPLRLDLAHAFACRPFPLKEGPDGLDHVVSVVDDGQQLPFVERSEQHNSELQSLLRRSYAVFYLQTKIHHIHHNLKEPYQQSHTTVPTYVHTLNTH